AMGLRLTGECNWSMKNGEILKFARSHSLRDGTAEPAVMSVIRTLHGLQQGLHLGVATRLQNRRLFLVEGEDSRVFINRLLTNRVEKTRDSECVYGGFLSPKGTSLPLHPISTHVLRPFVVRRAGIFSTGRARLCVGRGR